MAISFAMSKTVLQITDAELSTEVLSATEPVLLYFWATWCGPCRLMAPLMDKVASQYGDRLKVVKMEIDPNPESVSQFQVEGVPAFRLLKAGQVLAASEGAVSRQKLEEFIDTHLPPTA